MAYLGPASVLDSRQADTTTHVVRDRLTRHRSPARSPKRFGSDYSINEDEEVVNSPIPQPYRTSFSAVVKPERTRRDRSRSTSPSTSSLKGSNRSRSKSPGGRRAQKRHVTYADKVVIRESGTKDSVTILSDHDCDSSGHYSGDSSVFDSNMSNSSQSDYSAQLHELSQQIVREYSTSSETENHSPDLSSRNRNENHIKTSTPNGTLSVKHDSELRKPKENHRMNGDGDINNKMVVSDDYSNDRTISYQAASTNKYPDDIKQEAEKIIGRSRRKLEKSEATNMPDSTERRNSLPLDNAVEESSRLTPSKRSISNSIGNFFRRLSPHMGRRKKGNLSNASSTSLSPGDDLDGSFDKHASTHSLSRGKFRNSLRKLFGKSKRSKSNKSLNQSDLSIEELNESPKRHSRSEDESKKTPKTSLYMKSIEQTSKQDKDVYYKFKERQTPTRSGEANATGGKPQAVKASPRVSSPESESDRNGKNHQNGRINTSAEISPTGLTNERVDPPTTLDVRVVPKSIKSIWLGQSMNASIDDSIGDCSMDPNLSGSEPSLISQTSGSKHVAVSNDSVSPETNRDRNKNTNKSFSDINNSENKPPGDLDVKATYPLMPIISDSAEFIPKEIVRTPSYLRIASAVSGYGHYSRYSAYKGIEKRSPYSSTLSLRSSRSDLATPLSPVDMPIGKIPNYQPPTNYPPIRTNVLSPKSDNTFILDSPSEALNGAKNENTFRNLVNGDVTDSVNVVSVVNGENGHITPIAENGDSSESPESQTNGEITPCAENGHAVLVENFVTTGDNFKDADYFLQVTDDEETRLLLLCSKCEMEIAGIDLSEEVGGKVRAAIGKGNLLINQKFKQFRELCNQHKYPEEGAKPTKWEDLQGFWEMVKLQVDDVEEMFAELDLMRQNGWREIKLQSRRSSASSRSSPKSGSLSVSNTSTPSHTPGSRRKAKLKDTPESSPERTQKAKMAAKVREDNRKKLLAEKRAAMKQKKEQNNEAVEIFVADNGSKSNSGGEGSSNSAEGSEV